MIIYLQNYIIKILSLLVFNNLQNNIKKIAIYRFGSFGDSIVAFPTIKTIRKHYPNAEIHIYNKPENDNFKAYLAGISFNLSNVWFDFLQLDITAYKDDSVSGRYGMQFTPVRSLPFTLANVKFKFRGFTDFKTGNTNNSGNFNILAQPQMLIDIGDLADWKSDKVYIGTEYSYWYNKFGLKDVVESTVQGMVIAFF